MSHLLYTGENMLFLDLAAQQQRIRADLEARLQAVLAHNNYIMGPEVAELEESLARFAGAKPCVGCASGTDGLLIALMAWGIGPGHAVFVPTFTFFFSAETVALLGATPVMVDIDPVTFNMDPRSLEKALAAVEAKDASIHPLPRQARESRLQPRAVIFVDLFGQAADYDALLPLAQKHGLLTLEDAAQAFGAEYRGRKTCALGCDAGVTSFFPAKPLGAYGDGGALFTEDDALAALFRSILYHGKGKDRYDHVRLGINGRLDTMQAAVLLSKLEIFPDEIRARRQIAQAYAEGLASVPGLTLPRVSRHCLSVWGQYCILVADGRRDKLAASLQGKSIPTAVYYPTPLHQVGAFQHLGYAPEDLPVALACSREILALPLHPYLTEKEIARVIKAVAETMAC
jgi:dTDP-4-amino-4,6-dideoxygalactose transaminase